MTRLQLYVVKEVLRVLLPAFVVFLAIMMLGFGVQFLQEGLDFVRLWRLPYYVAVYSTPWVLPSAVMAAVIMAFSRLAADKEILAMQVEGMHLWHVIKPVYVLAFLISILGTYFHFHAAPDARRAMEQMQYEAGIQMLRERIVYSAGQQFYISPYMVSYDRYEDGILHNVRIIQSNQEGAVTALVNADTGTFEQEPESPNVLRLVLKDCSITQLAGGDLGGAGTLWASRSEVPMRVGSVQSEEEIDVEHMSFFDMRRKYRDLRREVDTHEYIYSNPGDRADDLRHEDMHLRAQRNELRRVRDRVRNRLQGLENDLSRDRQVAEERRTRLKNLENELEALRSEEAQYSAELARLMDRDAEDGEEFQRISEVQKNLNDVRRRIESLEEEDDKLTDELFSLMSVKEFKRRSVEERRLEVESLEREISNINRERDMTQEMRREALGQAELQDIEIRSQRRLTLAFAVLAFSVLGIPLGLLTRHRSTLLSFGIGFFLMLAIFYPFMVWGQIMAEAGMLHVIPAMWMGNGLVFMIGLSMTLALFRH